MTSKGIDFATVDLDNCHREPIHVPGYIQPHGLLFALDFQGRLTHVSRGAQAALPTLPLLTHRQDRSVRLPPLRSVASM